jgi:16S rRNA (cytosine1402-N4)-methyltransferase
MSGHIPVMLDTTLELLAPQPGRWYIDATFGAGGHAAALLAAGGRVLAIDLDPSAGERAAALDDPDLSFRCGNFRHLDTIAAEATDGDVAGILLDLGVSSMQLDEGDRGFAFRHDGPLDMRMGGDGPSAAELIADIEADELAAILYRYGDERHSRRLAAAIVAARTDAPIATTGRLAQVVTEAYPRRGGRDHPARRTFQALRIAVNDELGALRDALSAAERTLAPSGRLVVISYHSLEDRIVKQHLRDSRALEALTRKPRTAEPDDVAANPRARSAKLRAAERIAA